MAKIDVFVPCYNYGHFLRACVGSVLEQSVRDLRVLIIDDASIDGSLATARELAQADSRVSVVAHPENRGHIRTYNEGIEWAAADYCLLLSADDLLVGGALERAIEIMDADPDVVLTYGECIAWHDDLPFPTIKPRQNYTWIRHDLLSEMCATSMNTVPTPTAIARTRVQKAIGGYRPSLPHAGDLEMWLRFAANGCVARIDAVQAIYRKHATAMSNQYFAEKLPDYRQCQLAFDSFFDAYGDRLKDSHRLRTVARRSLAERMFRHGTTLIRRGHLKEGVRLMRAAIDLDRRLRYFPPLWRLMKIPGPAGREWAMSVVKKAAKATSGISKGFCR